jgi:hypothetical protein
MIFSYYVQLAAGLLGIEAGQDAVIRTLLYEIKEKKCFRTQ